MKISQKSIAYKVLANIKKNSLISSGNQVIVALSGGSDSVCLFDILFKLKDELKVELSACHYNHRLRAGESEKDKNFVKKICGDRGVECILGEAPKKNLFKNEEQAREARYAFFEKILGERRGAVVAVAHNENDLAETLLLRLFRGTGLKGLVSIPSRRKNFIRPLLTVQRSEIMQYLKGQGLDYRVDKSNSDLNISRNYLRLKILPLIERLNPNIIETLSHSANTFGMDYDLLSKLSATEFNKISKMSGNKICLDRKKWILLHLSLQSQVVRVAIEKKTGLKDVTNKQISEVCGMILKGESKKHKILPYSLRVELESGKIIISDNI